MQDKQLLLSFYWWLYHYLF